MTVVVAVVIVLGLMGVLLLGLELGRLTGQRRLRRHGPAAVEGAGAIEGGVFALLGLLLAFTFSSAAGRFDRRVQLIVEEANAIGTAYLRLDLLPASAQPALRAKFGRYVDLRLAAHRGDGDAPAIARLQGELWTDVVAACRAPGLSPVIMTLVLPALNEMLDVATTRSAASRTHVPASILALLIVLAATSSVLAGYGLAMAPSRSWIHLLGFSVILAITVYAILDYEFPRLGLIRIEAMDGVLTELRHTMP